MEAPGYLSDFRFTRSMLSAHVYFLARSHTNPDLRRLSDANQSCDGPNVDESRLTSFAVERTSNLQIGARLLVFWVCSHLALNKHWGSSCDPHFAICKTRRSCAKGASMLGFRHRLGLGTRMKYMCVLNSLQTWTVQLSCVKRGMLFPPLDTFGQVTRSLHPASCN